MKLGLLARIFFGRKERYLPRHRIMKNGLDEYIVQELTIDITGPYYTTISEYLPSLRQAEEELDKAEKKRSWEIVTPTK